jgi:predicted phage-related endonuclease
MLPDETLLEDVLLTNRVANCLRNTEPAIKTVGDLRKADDAYLMRIPNFGRMGLLEVRLVTGQIIPGKKYQRVSDSSLKQQWVRAIYDGTCECSFEDWKSGKRSSAADHTNPAQAEPPHTELIPSPEQIAARKGKLTASRIAALMNGASEAVLRLYLEMIGEREEERLDHVWPVRLGEATEFLQCEWFEEKYGLPVIYRGQVRVHPLIPWAACTLDGWIEDGGADYPLECKHVGGREPLETVIARYQPQMQWTMMVTGTNELALSVIQGANEPIVEYIDRHDGYITEMITSDKQFMECVQARWPALALDPVPSPFYAKHTYDMTGNNLWGHGAAEWLATEASATRAKDAEKLIKSLVPEDAKVCFGNGIRVTRDRKRRMSLRKDG